MYLDIGRDDDDDYEDKDYEQHDDKKHVLIRQA